jgi:RimJ/RimL family protein N-acetyltransferase
MIYMKEEEKFWGYKRCPLEREHERFNNTGALDVRYGEFALELWESGTAIGGVNYVMDSLTATANIGTYIKAEQRRRGYGVEGKQLLMCWLFDNWPLLRCEAVTLTHHWRARRGVELAGMSLESVSKRRRWSRGKLAGWLTYRIFREEWERLPIRQIVKRGQS